VKNGNGNSHPEAYNQGPEPPAGGGKKNKKINLLQDENAVERQEGFVC